MKPRKVKGDLNPQKFFEEAMKFHKDWMLKVRKPQIFMFLQLYKKEQKRIQVIAIQADGKHSPLDCARPIIERFDPDYYIVFGEGWAKAVPKDEGSKYIDSYQYGDISKLPKTQRLEMLIAIGKSKDGKHKFERTYKIKRNEREEVVGFDDFGHDKGTLTSQKLP